MNSHTIPRSGSLSRIARDGRVYTYRDSVSFAELNKNGGHLVPKLAGIRKASTFTGFCSKHDDAIFAPLEKTEFAGSAEQCFLLAYRAFSREMFTKAAQLKAVGIGRDADKGRSIDRQLLVQVMSDSLESSVEASLNDHAKLRPVFDEILTSGDMGDVRAYVIEFDSCQPVMCSGSIYPEQDFLGNQLQDLSDYSVLPHLMSVNSFFGGTRGAMVFTWLAQDDPTCRRFIQTLESIPDKGLASALVRMMFEFFENLCLQPEWWESLPAETQRALSERMRHSAIPWNPRKPDCLGDDGHNLDPWPVHSRYWVPAV